MDKLRSAKWWILGILLIFTPLASWAWKVVTVLVNVVFFFLGLVNPLGLFVATCIAAFLAVRALEL